MDNTEREKKTSFIHEKIVPRKNVRRVLLTVLTTIGLAILFGGVAGLTFYITRNVLGTSPVSDEPAPSVFIRDDIDLDETEEEIYRPDILDPDKKDPQDTGETDAEPPKPAETEEPPKEEPAVSVVQIYDSVKGGLARVLIKKNAGQDWIGADIITWKETFGAVVMETDEYVFLLSDASDAVPAGEVEVIIGSAVYETAFFSRDEISGLGVIRLPKNLLRQKLNVVPMGSSVSLKAGDRIYMIGTAFGQYISMEEGMITFAGKAEGTWDGYRQLYYTDCQRSIGGEALAFNENGEIVGWMSKYSAGDGSTAIACGISPLKYLIEDLCLKQGTAYLGMRFRVFSASEASILGISSGVYVEETDENGPAHEAGIQPGDRIYMVNGRSVAGVISLQGMFDAVRAGSAVEITVVRKTGSKEHLMTMSVVTEPRP